MNNEDFVTYDQAVQLKELGFDGECSNNAMRYLGVETPTLNQAQNWFFEKNKIYIEIYAGDYLNSFGYELKFDWADNHRYCCQGYKTPKEALSAGIDATLKYLENYDKEK